MDEFDFGYDEKSGPVHYTGGLTPVPYSCPWCGDMNETLFDVSGGPRQEYVEDCSICCSPIVITLTLDEIDNLISITAEPE